MLIELLLRVARVAGLCDRGIRVRAGGPDRARAAGDHLGINTLFASLSAAYSYFIEQGWCSENPLRFIRDLEVAERPFRWLQSAG